MSKFIFLNSTDSENLFPDNNSFDFTVDLERNITGRFLIALTDFDCENFTEPLFIFSDIINTSYINNSYSPVLKLVTKTGEQTNLQYHQTSRNSIQRIRIYIKDNRLNTPSTNIGRVSCVLKLFAY